MKVTASWTGREAASPSSSSGAMPTIADNPYLRPYVIADPTPCGVFCWAVREIPRHKRFESSDDETRLLNAADPHLRAVITALLDTACRPGEILNLQWRDVSLERREFVVHAVKAKTRTMRLVPISTRLLAILDLRRVDPSGHPLPGDAYVFGDELGRRIASVRDAWNIAAAAAGLKGFQLRDLRHESACRFEEAGTPVSDVSKLLGHTSLTTTSSYLMNMQRGAMRRAVDRLERATR